MHDNGMKELGFEWVVIDDCWHPTRAANGTLEPFTPYFQVPARTLANPIAR